jgi:hypothetical protein
MTSTTPDRKSRIFPVRSTVRPCPRRQVSGLASRSAQCPTVRAPRSLRSTIVNPTTATPMASTPTVTTVDITIRSVQAR